MIVSNVIFFYLRCINKINMKNLFAILAFSTLVLFMPSCSEPDPCYVGSWTMSNPIWITATTININNDGTGTMTVSDPSCTGNTLTRVYSFTYTVNDGTMAFAFSTQGKKCGNNVTFTGPDAISGITGTLTCEGDAMSVATAVYTYNFNRN